MFLLFESSQVKMEFNLIVIVTVTLTIKHQLVLL